MTRDELIDKTATHYSTLMISQYQTVKNVAFLKDILTLLLQNDPLNFADYYDLSLATGDHLTEIAYTIFQVHRSFDGITLNDDELKKVCSYAIIKRNIKNISLYNIQQIIYNVFNGQILVKCEPEQIIYFINTELLAERILLSLIQYNLLPQPINATLIIIKYDIQQKLFVLFDAPISLEHSIYTSWNVNVDGTEEAAFYIGQNDIIEVG